MSAAARERAGGVRARRAKRGSRAAGARARLAAVQRAARESEELFHTAFEQAGVGMALRAIDPLTPRWLRVNQKMCEIFGYTNEELLRLTSVDLTPPEDRAAAVDYNGQMLRGEIGSYTREKRYVRKDGSIIWARISLTAVRNAHGVPTHVLSMIEDITRHKHNDERRRAAEAALRRVMRARRVMAECRRALVHATTEQAMLDEMCRIVVDSGGYKQAWVGLVTGQAARPLHVVAYAGYGADAPMTSPGTWSSGTYVGLAAEALAAGTMCIAREIMSDPKHARVRARAEQLGYRCSIAFPLNASDGTLGVLVVHAAEDNAFDADELALLTELAEDVAFGVAKLRMREKHRQAEAQLRASERRLRETFEQAAVGIIRVDLAGVFVDANQKFCDLLGYDKHELLGMAVKDVTHPDDYGSGTRFRKEALAAGNVAAATQEKRYVRRDGTTVWTRQTRSLACDDAGKPSHVISIIEDIGQRKDLERRFEDTFEHAPIGIMHTSIDGNRLLAVNAKVCEMLGYRDDELLQRTLSELVPADDRHSHRKHYFQQMLDDQMTTYSTERRFQRKDGTLVWTNRTISLVRSASSVPLYFIHMVEDISGRKSAEERLVQLAHFDALTGLPNRALFNEKVREALAQARQDHSNMGVLFIDVDRFKNVNDTLGHAAGDTLLQLVGERLTGALRRGDIIARLGGDEFAVALTHLSDTADAAMVARKVVAALGEPFKLSDADIYVSASIGIALYPEHASDHDALLKNADAAMYEVKKKGRNGYEYYTPAMNARALDLLSLESSLRRALDRREFVLHYQPISSVATGAITGLEALLRWQHPERGLVSPLDFIPLLEETGLIVPVGEWVLQAACRQIAAWSAAGLGPLPVSVNMSARQFASAELGRYVERLLESESICPSLIDLEITETALMLKPEEATRIIDAMKELGVRISLDDFGTGYSSLSYLRRFPLDRVKIDRSFVREVPRCADDAAITCAVISMGHNLGLQVVAEGVETVEQLEFLRRNGCDHMQGYYLAKPMPGETCTQWLLQRAAAAAAVHAPRAAAVLPG